MLKELPGHLITLIQQGAYYFAPCQVWRQNFSLSSYGKAPSHTGKYWGWVGQGQGAAACPQWCPNKQFHIGILCSIVTPNGIMELLRSPYVSSQIQTKICLLLQARAIRNQMKRVRIVASSWSYLRLLQVHWALLAHPSVGIAFGWWDCTPSLAHFDLKAWVHSPFLPIDLRLHVEQETKKGHGVMNQAKENEDDFISITWDQRNRPHHDLGAKSVGFNSQLTYQIPLGTPNLKQLSHFTIGSSDHYFSCY